MGGQQAFSLLHAQVGNPSAEHLILRALDPSDEQIARYLHFLHRVLDRDARFQVSPFLHPFPDGLFHALILIAVRALILRFRQHDAHLFFLLFLGDAYQVGTLAHAEAYEALHVVIDAHKDDDAEDWQHELVAKENRDGGG